MMPESNVGHPWQRGNGGESPKRAALIAHAGTTTRESIERALAPMGIDVLMAGDAAAALAEVAKNRVDLVVLDLRLPGGSSLVALEQIKRHDPDLPVVATTGDASSTAVIETMKRGAFDFLLQPIDPAKLREVAARALEARRRTRSPEPQQALSSLAAGDDLLVGSSPAMIDLLKQIGVVSTSDAPVLIVGESGSGKELVARSIHRFGRRNAGPFVAVNCAALSEQQAEAELFGQQRAGFAGASARKPGRFEAADGGILFLDEVGDLAPGAQAKVLRALQQGEFVRVGGAESVRTDVRVIATTHRDVEDLVRQGRFRLDLFYRLNVFNVHVPPLRDRLDDVQLLAEHFIRRYWNLSEATGGVDSIAPETVRALREYAWPGNVRELENAVRKAIIFSKSRALLPDAFTLPRERVPPPSVERVEAPDEQWRAFDDALDGLLQRFAASDGGARKESVYNAVVRRVERRLILGALKRFQQNQSRAARHLGISRNNLRAKLKDYGVLE